MYSQCFICALLISGWCSLTSAELSSQKNKKSDSTTCIDIGDCPTKVTTQQNCSEICGCDKTIPTSFDNNTHDCVINIQLLMLSLSEKYNTEDNDMVTEDRMATKIQAEADKIFKGVVVAAFLFIACAGICTLTACIYCCRINYTDYQLKKSIKVLARKMGKKSQIKKAAKAPTEPMAQSCNVVVEEAGIFCV